jgi:hypothetical protein
LCIRQQHGFNRILLHSDLPAGAYTNLETTNKIANINLCLQTTVSHFVSYIENHWRIPAENQLTPAHNILHLLILFLEEIKIEIALVTGIEILNLFAHGKNERSIMFFARIFPEKC